MSSIEATSVVLKGLAEARESFLALGRRLDGDAHVIAVRSEMDARMYESGTCIEMFAEADLDTGNAACWWLDVREAAGGWVVEPSIFVQHSAGQDAIVELASRSIRVDAEFQDVLADVVAELTSCRERGLIPFLTVRCALGVLLPASRGGRGERGEQNEGVTFSVSSISPRPSA